MDKEYEEFWRRTWWVWRSRALVQFLPSASEKAAKQEFGDFLRESTETSHAGLMMFFDTERPGQSEFLIGPIPISTEYPSFILTNERLMVWEGKQRRYLAFRLATLKSRGDSRTMFSKWQLNLITEDGEEHHLYRLNDVPVDGVVEFARDRVKMAVPWPELADMPPADQGVQSRALHQRNEVTPTGGMFRRQDYWPFMFGVFVFAGLIAVPLVWGQFIDLSYDRLVASSLLGCAVFAYAHTRDGRFSIGRFLAAMAFAFILSLRAFAKPGGVGEFIPGGLLGFIIMEGCGWLGVGLGRISGLSTGIQAREDRGAWADSSLTLKEALEFKKRYSQFSSPDLRKLLETPSDLRPGVEKLVRDELENRTDHD